MYILQGPYLFFPTYTGKCWMDALELALRCSNLLIRTMTAKTSNTSDPPNDDSTFLSPLRTQMNESDCERHFAEFGKFQCF